MGKERPISNTLAERLRAYTTFDPVGGIKRQMVDDFIEAANAIDRLQAALREIAEECEYPACSLSPAEIAKMARAELTGQINCEDCSMPNGKHDIRCPQRDPGITTP